MGLATAHNIQTMGITVVQKSDLNQIRKNPKIALVLSGGAISGAAFKIGGLKAFNDYLVNKKLTDFDMYVGISAGAILAVPFAGGISPEEMLASLDGTSSHFKQFTPFDFYRPNFSEFFLRPFRYVYGHLTFLPSVIYHVLQAFPDLGKNFLYNSIDFFQSPSYASYEKLLKPVFKVAFSGHSLPSLNELLPTGLFDNQPIEMYLRKNMQKNRMPNSFRVLKRATGKSLYMMAVDLDTSQDVVFGPDEKNDLTISEAAQASSALPGFYKPARIRGVDYVDGSVRKTAPISLAVQKGAELVICYNPFRPYHNKVLIEYLRDQKKYATKDRRVASWGLLTVINQVFRTMIHSRLHMSLQRMQKDPDFKNDIILIEPKEDDIDFFDMNPLYFWNRAKAAKLGFDSVSQTIQTNYKVIEPILKAYGIEMSSEQVEKDLDIIKKSSNDDQVIMQVLEKRHPKHHKKSEPRQKLKIVRSFGK